MGSVKRCRSSEVPNRLEPLIQHGSHNFTFDRHRGYLAKAETNIRNLYTKKLASLSRCAEALVCGRLVGADQQYGLHERLNYCRQNRICQCCSRCREVKRAEGIADGIKFNGRDQLVTAVFTMPMANSYTESLDYMRRCLAGKSAVVTAIGLWNQGQGKLRGNRLFDYTMGLHAKPMEQSHWLWSHLHLTIVVGPEVRFRTQSQDGLEDVLSHAFRRAIDIPQTVKVSFKKQGRLGTKVLSPEARRAQHRGNVVLYSDVQKQLAYATTIAEKEDTPESVALRIKMLQELGSPSTFTRSRNRKKDGSSSRATADSQPHKFNPVALGKSSVYLFGLDGQEPEQIDPADFEKLRLKLIQNVKRTLPNQ